MIAATLLQMSSTKKSFSISIPTKPYLKKYIETVYGNPVNFSTKDYFGMTIALSLKKPIRNKEGQPVKKMRFDSFTSNFILKASTSWFGHSDYNLAVDENQALTVNKLMEQKFEEDLYNFCTQLSLVGVETKDALHLFCEQYNLEIDEDIAFEALKKKEYRYRKDLEKNCAELSRERTKQILKNFLVGTLTASVRD